MKTTTKQTLQFFWRHIQAYRGLTALMISALLAASCLSLAAPYFYKLFFDALASDLPRDQIAERLIQILLWIFGVHGVGWVLWRITQFTNDYFQPRIVTNIMNECVEYLQQHSYRFFSNQLTGSLLRKVGRLTGAFGGVFDRVYWDLIPLLIRIVIIFSVLFYLHSWIGVAMLAWTCIFTGFNYAFSVYKLKYDRQKVAVDTRVWGNLADILANNLNVKLFSGSSYEMKRFRRLTQELFRKMKKSWNLNSFSEAVQTFLIISLEVTTLYLAVRFWQKGFLTVGDFVWIQAYLIDLFTRLWNFGRVIRDLYERMIDAEEMIRLLNRKHEVRDVPGVNDIHVIRGKIEFQNVYFSYKKLQPVIRNLNLKIKPSEKVAFVGPSGGGKSTLTRLLMRLFDIQKGQILIDGQNIAKVTQNSLRGSISFVPQEPILFHRTLMDNIRYGRRNASDKEVMIAARMANCHDFIMKFPQKYNTQVGERGIKLSGGERQRVAIARAIVANAPILILDEATSSLDSESERLIQQALEALMKNKTTIIIAHRLSTIMRMDRIVVIQGGRIVEQGTHAKLLQKSSSLYKKLWDLQVGGYVVDE